MKPGDRVKFTCSHQEAQWSDEIGWQHRLAFNLGAEEYVDQVREDYFSISQVVGLWAPCSAAVVLGKEGVKADVDKLHFDLLPPRALEEVVKVYTMGAKKYEPWNWAKGMHWSRILAAMLRHTFAWMRGEDDDAESGVNHMAHVAWGCLTLLEYQRLKIGEDDRWKK